MTRRARQCVVASMAVAAAIGVVAGTARLSGQAPGFPSHEERRVAVLHGRRARIALLAARSDQRQSNFNQLEVAWRFKTDNLGTRPEFKLEGTPLMVKGVIYATGGTRRSVVALDAQDRRADLGARREGRRARRQRAASALGPRSVLLDRREG